MVPTAARDSPRIEYYDQLLRRPDRDVLTHSVGQFHRAAVTRQRWPSLDDGLAFANRVASSNGSRASPIFEWAFA